ncbi:hypothetical protein LMTR3_26685 [Bradyrhizobium sp. LMTR 3]|nr:hypothetical protein LMTR3_26685 [Bradyrhizobium sp. LMTR 3]
MIKIAQGDSRLMREIDQRARTREEIQHRTFVNQATRRLAEFRYGQSKLLHLNCGSTVKGARNHAC